MNNVANEHARLRTFFLLCALAVPAACSSDDTTPVSTSGDPDDFVQLDIGVCDPAQATFVDVIDNEFLPLLPGTQLILEGTSDDGTAVRVTIDVLPRLEEIAGVATQVVQVFEFEDDEIVERSTEFFAQTSDNTVCYFGEDVEVFEDGIVVGQPGAWRAGNGNQPGIVMPAQPRLGTRFFQEMAPGVAEDVSAIVAGYEVVSVPAGEFSRTIRAVDWNSLDGQTSTQSENKIYASGIGLIVDEELELTSFDVP